MTNLIIAPSMLKVLSSTHSSTMAYLFIFFFFLTLLPSSLLLLLPLAAALTPQSAQSRCPQPLPAQTASTFNVLVPNRTEFTEFAHCSDVFNAGGFAIDVFNQAMSILLPEPLRSKVTYTCFQLQPEGGSKVPTYDDMVNCLSEGYFDAVVGDVTIASQRLKSASFTQPYLYSGIVTLVPMVGQRNRYAGVLLQPFAAVTWVSICGSAVVTGIVLWFLEPNVPSEFRAALWFVASLLVFFKRETITNPLAKIGLGGWIVFILLLGSAYTATLSTILTVRKLGPENWTIDSVLKETTYGIGYQRGSIVRDYLNKTLGIPDERLLILNNTDDYVDALSKGPYIKNNGVAVILDEAPYVSLFLSRQPADSCSYAIVGPNLTSEGFGFAFSNAFTNLSRQFSMAILNLSENGYLQKLQTGTKISNYQCPDQVQSTQLDLDSSQGLFYFLLGGSSICFVMVLLKALISHYLPTSTLTRNRSRVGSNHDSAHVRDVEEPCNSRDPPPSATRPLRRELQRLLPLPVRSEEGQIEAESRRLLSVDEIN